MIGKEILYAKSSIGEIGWEEIEKVVKNVLFGQSDFHLYFLSLLLFLSSGLRFLQNPLLLFFTELIDVEKVTFT